MSKAFLNYPLVSFQNTAKVGLLRELLNLRSNKTPWLLPFKYLHLRTKLYYIFFLVLQKGMRSLGNKIQRKRATNIPNVPRGISASLCSCVLSSCWGGSTLSGMISSHADTQSQALLAVSVLYEWNRSLAWLYVMRLTTLGNVPLGCELFKSGDDSFCFIL